MGDCETLFYGWNLDIINKATTIYLPLQIPAFVYDDKFVALDNCFAIIWRNFLHERRVAEMMAYYDCCIKYIACLAEILLLSIWLKAFSGKRRQRRLAETAIIFCTAAVMLYTTRMEPTAFHAMLVLFYMLLLSKLLFRDRMSSLFFYTVSFFALGMTIELVFVVTVHPVTGFLSLLLEKGLQFAVCRLVIWIASAEKERCSRRYYTLFSVFPVVSCIFVFWIYAFGIGAGHEVIMGQKMMAERGAITRYFVMIMGAGILAANSAMVYLAGEIARIMADNRLFGIEAKHYQNLDELHEQYDIFLHDIKHMMKTIAALAKGDNCEEIENLITGMQISLGNMNQKIVCSHKVLNALLVEWAGYAKSNGAALELMIKEPLYFQEIEDLDLLALMGNLLDNAITAELHSTKREGVWCSMRMAKNSRHILIQIENSYDEKVSVREFFEKSRTLSKERAPIGAKHGIGLVSVREIVEKYGGIMENSKEDGRYRVKIILTVQSGLADFPSVSAQKIKIGESFRIIGE